MFLKKIYLALKHFLPTILFLVVGGIIAVYFQVDTLGAYILAAFMGWLQAFIDKVKEIGRQLELKRQTEGETDPPELGPSLPQRELTKIRRPRVKGILVDWKEIFARAKKPFIVLASVFILLLTIAFIYLYINF